MKTQTTMASKLVLLAALVRVLAVGTQDCSVQFKRLGAGRRHLGSRARFPE